MSCLLAGCSSADKKYVQKKETAPAQTVLSTAGHAEQYGELPKREHLWTIYWQTADVSATRQGFSTGDLRTVTGTVYKEEAPTTDFSADNGHAEKSTKRLLLKNNVHVISRTNKATLICDSLVYDGVKKLLTATGNVRIQAQNGGVGTFPILLATPDLKRFGTPDMFSTP